MRKLENITLGSDPELFIISKTTGKVVSSIGLIPGEKGDAWRDEEKMTPGFGIETDNILAEFNIPPATTKSEFINYIEFMKNYIKEFVAEKDIDLDIKCSASELVDPSQLESDEAKLFGCDPDFNAYTREENPKPKGETTNLRSAGFHIHIGYDNNEIETSLELIKYLDMYLGIPSILIDTDTNRRSLYGKAGSFRFTPYGIEYRTLSSAMMKTTERLDFVYNAVMNALSAFRNKKKLISGEKVQDIINNNKVNEAKKLLKKLVSEEDYENILNNKL